MRLNTHTTNVGLFNNTIPAIIKLSLVIYIFSFSLPPKSFSSEQKHFNLMCIITHLRVFTVYFPDVHQETKSNKLFSREILDSKVLTKYCIQP